MQPAIIGGNEGRTGSGTSSSSSGSRAWEGGAKLRTGVTFLRLQIHFSFAY